MTISIEIVEVITGETMLNENEVRAGDRAMKIFIPQYKYLTDGSSEVLDCHIDIKNQKQLEYVCFLLSVGLSSTISLVSLKKAASPSALLPRQTVCLLEKHCRYPRLCAQWHCRCYQTLWILPGPLLLVPTCRLTTLAVHISTCTLGFHR